MDVQQFRTVMRPVIDAIAGRPVDGRLEADLNRVFPAGGVTFRAIEGACHAALAAGWMCAEGGSGRRFGRVVEAAPETADLSIDVVDLADIVGPHHRHPTGEICLVMPVGGRPRFDGRGAGWCVNPPGSAHRPTVSDGRALVLYMLPGGRIDFTKP